MREWPSDNNWRNLLADGGVFWVGREVVGKFGNWRNLLALWEFKCKDEIKINKFNNI